MFDFVVDTIEEFKTLELWLFGLKLPMKLSGSIYVRETDESFFYNTIDIGNNLMLKTE